MRALNKLLSMLSALEPSITLRNVNKVEVEPPDLIVYRSNKVTLTRFLVCREVEYSVHDLSENTAKELMDTYIALFNSLPLGVHLYLVKEELDSGVLLRRVVSEILNTQADLDGALEESTRVKLNIKLNKLRALYTALLNGKPFTKISLVVAYRVESRDKDSAKSIANYYESLIVSSFKNHYGLKLGKATRDDIVHVILSAIGLVDKPAISKVEVEVERIAHMQPINIDILPSLDKSVILGFEKENLHPVEVKVEELFKHFAIIGPTGRGKTTLLSSIIEQLVAENLVNVVVVDFKGDLRKYLSNNVLTLLTPDSAPINILSKPSEIEDADWRAVVVESLTHASGAPSEAILKALITVESEGEESFTKYHHVSVLLPFIEFLRNEANYHLLVEQLSKNTLISVNGYGAIFQNAYVALCIGLVRYLLLGERDKLRMLLAIDDAWRILRLKMLAEIVREGRSKELGVIISTQSPDDLPDEIAENVYNIVLFGSRNKDYLKKAERMIGVKEDVIASLLKLSIGEAIYVNVLDKEAKVIKTYPPSMLQKDATEKVASSRQSLLTNLSMPNTQK